MSTESFSEVFDKIERGQRFVLGIDGLSRSGKTTLTDMFMKSMIEEWIYPL